MTGTILPPQISVKELIILGDGMDGGGQSTRLHRCLGPDGWPYLFKEYTPESRAKVRPKRLVRMVEWRNGLTPAERDELDWRCAWPRTVVLDADEVQGILIPEAPPEMYEVTSRNGTQFSKLRHLDILGRRSYGAESQNGVYYDLPVKLAILARYGETMFWLHDHGHAIGDLQPRNALFNVDGSRVFQVDCDACVPLNGRAAFPVMDPLDWKIPNVDDFGVVSDLGKYSWLIVRCLQENFSVRSLDREVLLRVMPTECVEILDRLCVGETITGAEQILRAKTRLWKRLNTPYGAFVQTDGSNSAKWVPLIVPQHQPEPQPQPEPRRQLQTEPQPQPQPRPRPRPRPQPRPGPKSRPRPPQTVPPKQATPSAAKVVCVFVLLVFIVLLVLSMANQFKGG
jgi:hypothetical protein